MEDINTKDMLIFIINELRMVNRNIDMYTDSNTMPYFEQLSQMQEWVQDADEYGIAYDNILALLESYPIQLTAVASKYLKELSFLESGSG